MNMWFMANLVYQVYLVYLVYLEYLEYLVTSSSCTSNE